MTIAFVDHFEASGSRRNFFEQCLILKVYKISKSVNILFGYFNYSDALKSGKEKVLREE